MSTTTVADLLEAGRLEASRYRDARTLTSREAWECFDTTTYRLLHTIAGPVRWDGRTGTHSLAMLSQVLDRYPRPLLPAMPDADLSARETANLLGVSVSTVHSRIRAGEIPARQDRGGYAVSITAIPTRTDIRPADPIDPHPLARLSCRLGALGDLLTLARSERAGTLYSEGLHRAEHQLALTSTVLAVAASAARTAVVASDLADVDRPLAVARYATAAIDTLGPATATPGPIARLASVSPVARPRTLNDRLEASVAAWLAAARPELDRTIPSTATLANIANQTVHLCAAAEAVALHPGGAGIGGSAEWHHRSLRSAACDAMKADHQWRTVTTAARPSHGYVDAARDLTEVLAAVVRATAAPDLAEPDTALAHVGRGLEGAHELLNLSAALADPLLRSRQLFAPARALQPSVERVHARAAGRYVAVSMDEGRPLLEATTQASTGLRCALPTIQQRPEGPVMKTAAPSLT